MKRGKILLSVLALSAFFSCDLLDDLKNKNGNDGSDNESDGQVQKIAYVNRQARSAKRGVSFNFGQFPVEDCAALGPSASWSYNWGNSIPSATLDQQFDLHDMDYIQMIWNGNYNADNIRNYKKTHPQAEYILAFNEPNLTDQANMTPSQAAAFWPAVKALAQELDMKLISPAMNYGTLSGYHDPIKWLDEFFEQPEVSLDDVDGIAIHCYMNNPNSVQSFVEMFRKYNKPVWLTEFCAGEGNVSESTQMAYMSAMFNFLEKSDLVERYAWFMPRGSFNSRWNNALLTTINPFNKQDIELTSLGKVYANMSTFDTTLYYAAGEMIPAEHYCDVSGKVSVRPVTDPSGGILEIDALNQGGWADYLVDVAKAGTYTLEIRYTSFIDVNISISADGEKLTDVLLENAQSVWRTETVQIQLPAGKHTLRFGSSDGYYATYNYFRITEKPQ